MSPLGFGIARSSCPPALRSVDASAGPQALQRFLQYSRSTRDSVAPMRTPGHRSDGRLRHAQTCLKEKKYEQKKK